MRKRNQPFIITTTHTSEDGSEDEIQALPDEFLKALEDVFPHDLTIGEKYIVINENMFVNDNWLKLNKRIYKKQFMQFLKRIFPIPFLNEPRKKYDQGEQHDESYEYHNPMRFYTEIRDHLPNFDDIFGNEIQKEQFFDQAKGKISSFLQDHERVLLYANSRTREAQSTPKIQGDRAITQDYYTNCNAISELPLPTFAKIIKNTLILKAHMLSESHAMVLKHFLIQNATSLNEDYKIQKLVIDDCALSDKSFALILEGLVTHRDHIKQVTYY
jgi:hypothetical protein